MSNTRRFIEDTFPVKEVSIESAREKNIRHGHISTLHIWWARRPLASSRATNYAALIPAPDNIDEWDKKRQFIIDFSKWENSLNPTLIEKAREDILKANNGVPPKVLDPFGGGGAIPLEALRLGCETYSNDLNPVAVLIQKCTLEYLQKYGKPKGDIKRWEDSKNPLLEDVKKWSEWVLEEARKLAQSCSIDLSKEWSRQGFIKKDKEFISVLGPQDRKIDDVKNSSELIDVLHGVLLLWEESKRDEMVTLLQDSGFGKGEAFYRVAQAVSETLPIESKEKKLLDGFMAGRERLREEIRKEAVQARLGE